MSQRLKIAVQKKGRLSEDSFALLKQCGLSTTRRGDALLCAATNFPVDLLLLRDDDIPSLVVDGICDLGIVGQNVLEEETLEQDVSSRLQVVEPLGFSRCTLKLAGPKSANFGSSRDLAGMRIATTYPNLTRRYLTQAGITAEIVELKGGVEIAPSLGLVDAICDLVSSGATLAANGLAAFETVMESEAVLVRNADPFTGEKQVIFERLLSRIRGVIASRDTKYIMLNAPRAALTDITNILPGVDAPTIMDLAGETEQVAVHAVCRETVFWDTLEQLKSRGARDILVLPIEKMMS